LQENLGGTIFALLFFIHSTSEDKVGKKFIRRNQKGFTLIELISIMIILGVIGSVAIRKYDNLTHTASEMVLATAVKELNVRESLIWTNMKISSDG
jgi:prepilin-type N-terminal cleavage/methylation domain-containing protein